MGTAVKLHYVLEHPKWHSVKIKASLAFLIVETATPQVHQIGF